MRRHETLLALAAVVLASLAALQIQGRLFFALAAVALLIFVGYSRIRSSVTERRPKAGVDSYDRAERIRQERDRRMGK